MDKYRHHIDSTHSSVCSQQVENSPLIIKDQPECHHHHRHHRNNHNSCLIQNDKLIQSTSTGGFRKRRTTLPSNHDYRFQSLPFSTIFILIRLLILLMIGLILYYVFIYIYPKPKRNGWEQVWYTMIDWLSGE